MKGRSSRIPVAVDNTQDDWVDESWTVDCVCGVNFDDGEEMVNCDECGVWVHTRCSRYVKDDAMFSCDKCKSRKNRNEREENEVAQLLVDLPTKTIRREKSSALRYSGRYPFRPWADIPIEERVHVHGIPGGDPSLFEGVSSVFSRELWKCTGHVPKKFKFKYQDSSFCDVKKECWEEKDPENHINEGAGLLFSLSKDISARTQFEVPRVGGHGLKQEENSRLEGKSVDIMYKAKDEEKFFVQKGAPVTSGDHGKVEVQRTRERGGKKKVKAVDKEYFVKIEGLQNAKNARKKGVKADDSSFNLPHLATTHLKKQNIEINQASGEGISIAPDCSNGTQNHGCRSFIVNLAKSKSYDEDLPSPELDVKQGQVFQKSNAHLTPASTFATANVKTESETISHSRSTCDDNKTDVIRKNAESMGRRFDHTSEICKPSSQINNVMQYLTYNLRKQEPDCPDSSLMAAHPGSKEPLVLGGLPGSSSLPMKSRSVISNKYFSVSEQVANMEPITSDVGTDDNKRRVTSRKTTKENSASSCTSKGPRVNHIPCVNVLNPTLPDSPMVASSTAPVTPDTSFISGDGDSAVVAASGVEMQGILPLEGRIPVFGLSRNGEKICQSNILQYPKGNSTSLLQSTFLPNAPASLSDEELALLLHQELNSSPRVPRVPCMRQAGSFPQSSSSAVTGTLVKRSSYSVKDNGSVSRRRSRDISQISRENEDGTPRTIDKILRLSDQGKSGLVCSTDAFIKKKEDSTKCVIYAKKRASSSKTATNVLDSFTEIDDHNMPPTWDDSPMNMFNDDVVETELCFSRTLPGLIGKIMGNGRRVTFEELCDAILPHWNGLRKQNGELYTFSSHSNAVLDCLSKREDLAHLVDHSTKEKEEVGCEGVEAKEGVRRGCSPRLEEFPKGKRKARKRRKVISRGGTKGLLMMGAAKLQPQGVEEEEEETADLVCGSSADHNHDTEDTSSSDDTTTSDDE